MESTKKLTADEIKKIKDDKEKKMNKIVKK